MGKDSFTRLCACPGQGRIDGNAGVQAEVVAHVKRCVRFSGMADFQYASCTHLPQGAEVCALGIQDALEIHPQYTEQPSRGTSADDLPIESRLIASSIRYRQNGSQDSEAAEHLLGKSSIVADL